MDVKLNLILRIATIIFIVLLIIGVLLLGLWFFYINPRFSNFWYYKLTPRFTHTTSNQEFIDKIGSEYFKNNFDFVAKSLSTQERPRLIKDMYKYKFLPFSF